MSATTLDVTQRVQHRKVRVGTLDGIRGLCALTVLVTHVAFATIVLSSAAGEPPQGIWSIIAAGQVGAVGPFFILSGLLLYRPFAKAALGSAARPAMVPFFMKRAARLLPAFYLVTVFCLAVLNYDAIDGPWDVLRPFLLAGVYDPHFYAGLDVAWTVPAEAQYYLALPIMAWLMHRLANGVDDPGRKARRMLIVPVVMMGMEVAWTAYIHARYETWTPQFFYPFSVCALFAAGMVLALWSVLAEVAPTREPRLFGVARRHPNLFWLGALVAWGVNCAQPLAIPGTADWLPSDAAVIREVLMFLFSICVMIPVVVPRAPSATMVRVLTNWPMRYLGRISYGLYVWHFAVMYVVFGSGSIFGQTVPVHALLGKYGFWELVVPVLVGTIAVASVSFWLIERPILIRVGSAADRYAARRGKTVHTADVGALQPDASAGTRA